MAPKSILDWKVIDKLLNVILRCFTSISKCQLS